MKNKTIIIAIVSFALGALIYNYASILFQEGNPFPFIKGIVQLNFANKDIVKLSGSENTYLTKSKNGQKTISDFLKNQDFNY